MSVNIKQNGSLMKISGSSSWTGTRAEYEAVKDTIPIGSVVNITDDEDAKLVLPSDQQQVYSTNEIQIGTWIDGKPIYRKVLIVDFPKISIDGKAYSKTFDISELNIDVMITQTISQIWGDYNSIRYNMINPLPKYIQIASNAITSSESKFRIIIEYTKTID